MKKLIIIVIVILLCLGITGCNHEITPSPSLTPFTIEAGRAAFVQHNNFVMPTAVSTPIDLGKNAIETFNIEKGLIVLSKNRTLPTIFTKSYAVANTNGEYVINYSENSENDIVYLCISNNIIITYNQNYVYTVYNLQGTAILSNITCVSVDAIGEEYIKVSYDSGNAQVYDLSGNGIFFSPLTYPSSSSNFYSCAGTYLMTNNSQGIINIYNNDGSLVKSYRDSGNTSYRAYYLSENNFYVIEDIVVTSSENYEILINSEDGDIFKIQKQYIYSAVEETETELASNYFVYSFANGYSNSIMNMEVNKGFSYMSVYNIDANRTININEPYIAYIIDDKANQVIRIEEDVYPFIYYKDEIGAEKNGLNIRLISLNGNILIENEEAVNTVLGVNEGIMIVGKTIESELRYAAYDSSGTRIIDYDYNALSVFAGGYAIGSIGEEYYRVETNGTRTIINMDIIAFNSLYGIYLVEEDGLKKLYNTRGDCLIDLEINAVEILIYTDYNNNTYIATVNFSNDLKVYKLL